MPRRTASFIALIVVATFLLSSVSADWPSFQKDPGRTATSSAPAIARPKVIWKQAIGIQGYLNNPVLTKDRVFVGSSGVTHNKSDAKDGIYCLNRTDGEIIWHKKTPIDACGVAVADGRVFSTGDDGFLRAWRATDGKVLWAKKRKGELYSQPLVLKGLVIVGDSTGTVLAVEQKTGVIAWSTKLADTNVRGGVSSDGKRLYVAFLEGKVACLDMKGEKVWSVNLPDKVSDLREIYPAPTVAGERLIIAYAKGGMPRRPPAIIALNKNTGGLLWRTSDPGRVKGGEGYYGNIRSSPAVYKDLLVYGEPYSNDLVTISVKDGAVAWKVSMGARMFPHYPSPAVAGGVAYLPRHDGGLYAVDLQARKLKWSLYLGHVDKIGDRLPDGVLPEGWEHGAWDPGVGKAIYASPAIGADGTLFIGTGQGYIYAIGESKAVKKSKAK